ncbi:MAG: ATP-binding protein [Chitinophagaceae bacterium]|nr:ATP-binding protein [Chitinophagaceae bacterium]
MYRTDLAKLHEWKASSNRKPLIIKGARQVGKTWLMKYFGTTAYEKVAYINFESNPALRGLFDTNFDIARILLGIEIETGIHAEPHNTLIIFDEIQEAPKAITSLKYFAENAPDYHIMAAGSLLGILLSKGGSFPVGKVNFMEMFPLSFSEFLIATGAKALAEVLQQRDWVLITSFKDKLVTKLKEYFYVGGMPEVVQNFSVSKSLLSVRSLQQDILNAYERDFSKHAPPELIPRIRMIWNSIPSQLAREQKKFIYGLLKEGARAREFENALLWLLDCGLVYKVHQVTKPGLPLKAYEDPAAFKLFSLDTGLLGALTGMNVTVMLDGNQLFEEFKGSLTEQFVLQQLLAQKKGAVYYFSESKGQTEIDFLIDSGSHVVPIEVKAAENLRSKSLKTFYQKYQPTLAIRSSLSNYREESWMTNLPLYAVETIWDYAAQQGK